MKKFFRLFASLVSVAMAVTCVYMLLDPQSVNGQEVLDNNQLSVIVFGLCMSGILLLSVNSKNFRGVEA